MTKEQSEKVKTMREEGMGYVRIAQALGVSENTVKSFCRRNNLTTSAMKETKDTAAGGEHLCHYCGKPVPQNPGRKEKKFCSDECRMKWWNSHQDRVNRKANYDYVCKYCGKPFTAYGNANRKYCCHECFIADRFGGGR